MIINPKAVAGEIRYRLIFHVKEGNEMARAKCKICGASLDTNTAYKVEVIINKRTGEKELTYKYCCSEEEWQTEETRKKKAQEDKDKVYYLICDIMGVSQIIHTALWKEKQTWNQAFSDEFIAKYLQENKDYLTSAIARTSGTEYAKIRYLSAILKNSLRDFKPKIEVKEIQKIVVEEAIYEAPIQSLNKRRSLDDLEDMF